MMYFKRFYFISFLLVNLWAFLSISYVKAGFSLDKEFYRAVRDGRKHDVMSFIKYNPNVNYVDKYGLTPLHFAALKGYSKIAICLMLNGANVNAMK